MNEDRVKHLIKTMEKVIRRDRAQDHSHLDMDLWSTTKKRECGTTACAAGHEALTRYANDKGLRLKREPDGEFIVYYDVTDTDGFTAMADYLDIDYTEADFVFNPSSYVNHYKDTRKITARHVIKRIKWMMKGDRIDDIQGRDQRQWHTLPGGLDEK